MSVETERYSELVPRHWTKVFAAVYRMTGQAADAEDLAQETFLRAYVALASFKPGLPFANWLRQIASRLALNLARSRAREGVLSPDPEARERFFEALPDPDPAAQPVPAADAAELQRRLRAALARLPEEQRLVLVMRHVLELSHQEICEVTGLPIGTVKSRLDRARRRLAALLAEPPDANAPEGPGRGPL
jgi:RNA polymerase sigma-70 factor (ECF subfamily)